MYLKGKGVVLPVISAMQIIKVCLKLPLVLLLAISFRAGATRESQTVTISGYNLSLEQLFETIEHQTDYVFFYATGVLRHACSIDLYAKNATVEKLLYTCLEGQPVDFIIKGRIISIVKRKTIEGITPRHEVRGLVMNENNIPLGGARIRLPMLNKEVRTKETGEFIMKDVPNGPYTIEMLAYGYKKSVLGIEVLNNLVVINVALQKSTDSIGGMPRMEYEQIEVPEVIINGNRHLGCIIISASQEKEGKPVDRNKGKTGIKDRKKQPDGKVARGLKTAIKDTNMIEEMSFLQIYAFGNRLNLKGPAWLMALAVLILSIAFFLYRRKKSPVEGEK